uniref:Uncharacterized protein n=1 Tax=Anguilla anguilla TaxID=7936 RepID=A0A0E9PA38_ANGAN
MTMFKNVPSHLNISLFNTMLFLAISAWCPQSCYR